MNLIIQARNNSSRLPKKMMLPFYKDKGIFELLCEKLVNSFDRESIILATTINIEDDPLVKIATKYSINIHRGPEDDVLLRFIQAAEKYNCSSLVRICADNPFLDIDSIKELIEAYDGQDYLSFSFSDGTPSIKSHLGLFTEITSINTLIKVYQSTEYEKYREHVTNYIYEHSDQFDIKFLELPKIVKDRKDIRLTLDTEQDFYLLKDIYTQLIQAKEMNLDGLIKKIDRSPDILHKMQTEIIENEK